MEIVVKVLQLILSLSILIIIHECGHFFFAKLFKTRVEKFYLFFNPWFTLFKFKKGETEYGIGWLPLGGYVKIAGMIDESMDLEQMKQPPQPYEFRSKPTWQRLIIMLGGVFVNFVFALFIYAIILFKWGETYLPNDNLKYGIAVDSIAYSAGLRDGDKIISIDYKKVENFDRILPTIALYDGKSVQLMRDNKYVDIKFKSDLIYSIIRDKEFIAPRIPFIADTFLKGSLAEKAGFKKGDKMLSINGKEAVYFHQFVREIFKHRKDSVLINFDRNGQVLGIKLKVPESGILGIARQGLVTKHVDYNFWESFPAGISRGMHMLKEYVLQFKLIFSRKAKGYESVGWLITIGSIFPSYWDWYAFWNLTALISIMLAFINVLPIPALDGGHVLFVLYEMITGRKPSDKFLEYAQLIGLIIILAIVVFALSNDFKNIILKK